MPLKFQDRKPLLTYSCKVWQMEGRCCILTGIALGTICVDLALAIKC